MPRPTRSGAKFLDSFMWNTVTVGHVTDDHDVIAIAKDGDQHCFLNTAKLGHSVKHSAQTEVAQTFPLPFAAVT